MITEIWSAIDRIFYFGLFFFFFNFTPLTTRKIKILKKRKNSLEWFLRYRAWQIKYFVILNHFLHFHPLNNPKNKNFEKMKIKPGDIIILHMCTINDNHMMYGSWDIECNRQIFLWFWTIFCPFIPLTTWKIKFFKKMKKMPRDISILHMFAINDNHMMHGSQDRAWQTEFFVILDRFLSFYLPNNLKNQNFEKLKKTHQDIIILHKCPKNHDQMLYYSWDMACNRYNCYFSFWAIFCPYTSLTAQKIKI